MKVVVGLLKNCIKVVVSILVICSCYRSENHWSCDSIKVQNTPHSSSRLIYKDNLVFPELELEFVNVNNKIYGYLNICFQEAFTSCKEAFKRKLVITIDGKPSIFFVNCLCGGQRVALSQEIILSLFSALRAGQTVKVALDDMEEEMSLTGFSENYGKFLNYKAIPPLPKVKDFITLEY